MPVTFIDLVIYSIPIYGAIQNSTGRRGGCSCRSCLRNMSFKLPKRSELN